jgi:hypothetical protein
MLAALVAVVAAAAAIWLPDRGSSNAGNTYTATEPNVALGTFRTTTAAEETVDTSTLPKPPEPTISTRTTTAPARQPNGETEWPEGQSGWTVVLVSYPLPSGRDAALEKAKKAAKGGLPDVGVLVSSRYSSLHPGYFVVFSGIYESQNQARAARRTARSNGFAGAYERPITR